MKSITKMSREELIKTIGANVAQVKKQDTNLFDRLSYADRAMKKNPKAVSKTDLVGFVKEIANLLGDAMRDVVTPAPAVAAENSVKPKLSTGKKSTENKAQEETPAKEEKAPATKKAPAKKDAPKKSEPEQKKSLKKAPAMPDRATAESFPEELSVGDSAYTLAHDITDMGALLKAINDEQDIVFAFFWTPGLIKSAYGATGLAAPKKFDNDLDLASTLYVSDECKVCYSLSMYTEVLYQIMPEAFEEIDGVRYSAGIEFQIYRQK